MNGFLFGGSTGETPETLKRKRQIAEALVSRSAAPKNVGEGLSAIGNALIYRSLMGKADAAEKTGRESASNDFAPLLGGFGSPPPGATGSAMPKVDAGGNVPIATAPDEVKSLIAANVPPELQAYATNLIGKESSFDPNAVSPTGATGLAQFTKGTGKQYGLVSDQGDMRKDPVANLKALVALTNDNRAGLANALGRAPTDGELALAHQQGLQGAINLLSGKSVPGNNLAVNNIDPNSDPRAAADKIMAFYGGTGGQQVASLDPAAGMPQTAPQAIDAASPPSGYVDPQVTTDSRQLAASPAVAATLANPQQGQQQPSPVPQALAAPPSASGGALPPLPVTEVGPTPNVASVSPVAEAAPQPNQQVAQALLQQDRSGVGIGGDAPGAGYFPAAPNAQGQGPSQQQIMQVLTNPYASDSQKAVANALLQRSIDASDPNSQLGLELKRAQLDALKAKPKKEWQKLSDTTLFNPETSEVKDVSATGPGGTKQFRFPGNSVEAAALNGLIDGGQLTPEQAQQLGAGKTITDPATGTIVFMTPQGVFGKPADGGPAQPISSPGQQAGTPAGATPAAPSASPAPAAPAEQRPGMIPLTSKKPEKPLTESEGRNSGFLVRANTAQQTLNDLEDQGTSLWNNTVGKAPYVGNFLRSEDAQKYDQAKRNFINAQLRRESGAVISPPEFENAEQQYFPQPGDGKEVIEQKRKNRDDAIRGLEIGSGAGADLAKPQAGNSADLDAAREAIARGAPRDAVIKRLQDANIDPTGL